LLRSRFDRRELVASKQIQKTRVNQINSLIWDGGDCCLTSISYGSQCLWIEDLSITFFFTAYLYANLYISALLIFEKSCFVEKDTVRISLAENTGVFLGLKYTIYLVLVGE